MNYKMNQELNHENESCFKVNFLSRTLERFQRVNKRHIFLLYKNYKDLKKIEQQINERAMYRVSAFARICQNRSEKQLSKSSIEVKKAFYRWFIRTNYEFGHSCIDKIIQSSRKTNKNVAMIFRILVKKQMTLKKKKFLQFVGFLVAKLERSREKILQNNKNFFYFSVCLIASKKKNEEFSRAHSNFIHLLNFKIGQKTSDMVEAVGKNSPKALLMRHLLRGCNKKKFECLQSMHVYTKKTNFIITFKFVDLVQSRILSNMRTTIENNVSVRNRFVELFMQKTIANLKRFMKLLINRSAMLKNRITGFDKFFRLIEKSLKKSMRRYAFSEIKELCSRKINLEKFNSKSEILSKLRNRSIMANYFQNLRLFVEKIKLIKIKNCMKKFVLTQKGKLKSTVVKMRKMNAKFKAKITLIYSKIGQAFNFYKIFCFDRLRLNAEAKKYSDQNSGKTSLKFSLLEKFNMFSKIRKLEIISRLKKFNNQQKNASKKLCSKLTIASKSKKIEVFTFFLKMINFYSESRKNIFKGSNKLEKTFQKLIKSKIYSTIIYIQALLKKIQNGCLILQKIDKKNNSTLCLHAFYFLKNNNLIEKHSQTMNLKEKQKKIRFITGLIRASKHKTKDILTDLKNKLRKFKKSIGMMFNLVSKNVNFTLFYHFQKLQKNKELYSFTTDQEKRKIKNIRISNCLQKFESSSKKMFFTSLKVFIRLINRRDYLIRKISMRKFKMTLALHFSKLLSCARKEKFQEIDKILAKTKNDLSAIHREVLPHFNKLLIKHVFFNMPKKMAEVNQKIVIDKLRRFNKNETSMSFLKEKICKILDKKIKSRFFKELKIRTNNISKQNEKVVFNIFQLEVLIRNIHKSHKKASIEAFKNNNRELNLKKKCVVFFVYKILHDQLKPALKILKEHHKIALSHKISLKVQSEKQQMLEKLKNLEKKKFLKSSFLFLTNQKKIDQNKSLFVKLLVKSHKQLLLLYFKHLSKVQKEQEKNESHKKGETKIIKRDLKILLGAQNFKKMDVFRQFTQLLRRKSYISTFKSLVNAIFLKNNHEIRHDLRFLIFKKFKLKSNSSKKSKLAQFVVSKLKKIMYFCLKRLQNFYKSTKKAIKGIFYRIEKTNQHKKRCALEKFLKLSTFYRAIKNNKEKMVFQLQSVVNNRFINQLKRVFKTFTKKFVICKEKIILEKCFKKASKNFLKRSVKNLQEQTSKLSIVSKTFEKMNINAVQKLKQTMWLFNQFFTNQQNQEKVHKKKLLNILKKTDFRIKKEVVLILRLNSYKFRKIKNLFNKKRTSLKVKLIKCFEILKNTKTIISEMKKIGCKNLETFLRKKIRVNSSNLLLLLRQNYQKSKFQRLINILHHLKNNTTKKISQSLRKMKNPGFKKSEFKKAFIKIINSFSISDFNYKKTALLLFKKLSSISQLKTFKKLVFMLTNISGRTLLWSYLTLLASTKTQKRKRLLKPEKLVAIRYVKNRIYSNNTLDPRQLLYPCLLKLRLAISQHKTSPSEEILIRNFDETINFTRPTGFEEQKQKRIEVKIENINFKAKNNAIEFGNMLLIEKNQVLLGENAVLEKQAENLKTAKEELAKDINQLYQETDECEEELNRLQKECSNLKNEREQLKNEQKVIEEKLVALDPNFDLNASKLRMSYQNIFNDHPRQSNMFLARAFQEKKDLENLVLKYQDETRQLEEEVDKFEQEELEFIANLNRIKAERNELDKKLKSKEELQKALSIENDRLKLQNEETLKMIAKTKNEQDNFEKDPKTEFLNENIENKKNDFNIEKQNLIKKINELSQKIDKNQDQFNFLTFTRKKLVPADKSTSDIEAELLTRLQEIEIKKTTINDLTISICQKLCDEKKDLANMLSDRGYLQNQKTVHHDNIIKFEKELLNPGLTQKQRQLLTEKINLSVGNVKVIDDNIEIMNPEINLKEFVICQIENDFRVKEEEVKNLDEEVDEIKKKLSQLKGIDHQIEDLLNENDDLINEKKQIEAVFTQTEQNEQDFLQIIESELEKDKNRAESFSKKKQEIAELEDIIINNLKKIEKNEKTQKQVEEEKIDIEKLIMDKVQKTFEIDIITNQIIQKKENAKILAVKSKERELENVKFLDGFNRNSSMIDSSVLANGTSKPKTNELIDIGTDQELDTYPPYNEFQMNEYSQILASDQGPQSRRKLAKRLAEIRENLKEAGKNIDEKDENIKKIQEKLTGNEHLVSNFNQILNQKSNLINEVQEKIVQNIVIIDENKRLFEENAQKIQKNREMIAQNYDEIKEIDQNFTNFKNEPKMSKFGFYSGEKDYISKKIQTNITLTSESRSQTDMTNQDILEMIKKANQRHILKTKDGNKEQIIQIKGKTGTVNAKSIETSYQPIDEQGGNFAKSEFINQLIHLNNAPITNLISERLKTDQFSQQNNISPTKQLESKTIFAKKVFAKVEKPISTDEFDQKDEKLDDINQLQRDFIDFKTKLAVDKKDNLGFVKKCPVIDYEILQEIEILQNNRLKYPIQAERKKSNSQNENLIQDYISSSNCNDESNRDIAGDMSFSNFLVEAKSEAKSTRKNKFEFDNLFEFIIPKMGETDLRASISQSQKFQSKIFDTIKTLNAKRLLKISVLDNIIKIDQTRQILTSFYEIKKEANFIELQQKRRSFPIAKVKIVNNKKIQMQFQLKALKDQKIARNKILGKTFNIIFKRRIFSYFYTLIEILENRKTKTKMNALFHWKKQNMDQNHREKIKKVRNAKNSFDGAMSRFIFRQLSQSFRSIIDFAHKRHQNFFQKFIPVISKADERLKNHLMDVLQYWFNIKGENNWNTKIIRHFVFKASLTPQIAALRMRLFTKKASKNFHLYRTFIQKVGKILGLVVFQKLKNGFKKIANESKRSTLVLDEICGKGDGSYLLIEQLEKKIKKQTNDMLKLKFMYLDSKMEGFVRQVLYLSFERIKSTEKVEED